MKLARPLQALLSLAILVWIYTKVDVSAVAAALTDADLGFVLGGSACVMLLQIVVADRWGVLVAAQGITLPLRTLLRIQLASVFYKLFIPGGMVASIGVRTYKLQRVGGSGSASISSVVVDRLLATFGLGVLGVIAWLVDEPRVPDAVGWTLAAWVLAMLAMLVVLLNRTTGALAVRLAGATKMRAVQTRVERIVDALALFRDVPPARVVRLVLLSLLPHVVGVFLYACVAAALGIQLNLIAWAWIRAAVSLLTTQPISIAGLGVREVLFVWILAFYGVDRERALAMASLFLGVAVLLPALAGALVEGREAFGPRKRAQDARGD